jgi:pimeloyl-ACP methyl ester carboxylesterase
MTGPEGDQPHGYWDIVEVDPPRSLVFRDGFANDDGSPNTEFPLTTARVTIEELGGGRTRMSIQSLFPSTEAMEQVLALGAEEGLKQAVGQIDAILAEDAASGTAKMTTHTLDVPGATLTYDVRPNDASTEPTLLLIGSPMGAAGFGTLSRHFSDRTVVTYDPRGVERSAKTDPASLVTPDVHADDLHRIIQTVGGPVDLFATSGGAVNALALVAKYPEDVRTLVAHEPPLAPVLPDAEHAMAAVQAIHEIYQRSGFGAGMAKFISIVSHRGPFTAEIAGQPAPDPAMFGLPTTDDGSRTDPLLGQNIVTGTLYEPDFDALRSASTRIVLAAGEGSEGEMANRGAFGVAERLGDKPVTFPGDHGGFLGGEYGQTGDPDAFAAKLREVLADKA